MHESTAQDHLPDLFGEPISIYTRQQALSDGELVDVDQHAREIGFRFPVALTRSVWQAIENIPERYDCEDVQGRTHDVLWMAYNAARRAPGGVSRIVFEVILHTTPDAPRRRVHYKQYLLDIGPGDTVAPVITIGEASDF